MGVCLLRVGIDTSEEMGGTFGPLLSPKGRFEYVPVKEAYGRQGKTYGQTKGENTAKLLSTYVPELKSATVHYDPEFRTNTYGDFLKKPKQGLRFLKREDLLVFYAGLEPYRFTAPKKRGLYIIGYFEVEKAGLAREYSKKELKHLFAANFHVRPYLESGIPLERKLFLVKGKETEKEKGSRLLRKARLISNVRRRDCAGRWVWVLNPPARSVLGKIGNINCIQRAVPHWVKGDSAEWIRKMR